MITRYARMLIEQAEERKRRQNNLLTLSYRKIRRKARKGLGRVLKESPTGYVIAKRLNEYGENDYQPISYGGER